MPSPTPQQQAVLDFAASSPDNLMIQSRAGTGKTTMLEMLDGVLKGPNLLVCFNKSVADEAQKRMKPATTVKTLNSIGHSIWAGASGHRLSLAKDKQRDIFRALVDAAPRNDQSAMWERYDLVMQGVNLARAIGYVPSMNSLVHKRIATFEELTDVLDETPDDHTHSLIDDVLSTSIAQGHKGIVDFNDQLYLPALFGGNFPRFANVLIDEYQDLSPINLKMVGKLARNSRQFGVGDDAQAIYAFRGATVHSMQRAIEDFNMHVLPLSVSFRCPSVIVANVRWRVPEFSASRDGGIIDSNGTEIEDNSTVICRNNAPLVAVAMKLLAQGKKIDMAGTDISNRILRQLNALGSEETTQAQAMAAVDSWLAAKLAKESKTAEDTAECMRVFLRHGKTLGSAMAYARHLFALSGTIRFMSGHKAKGLEFDHVYHLDMHLIRRTGQDPNVHYVIDTRAREKLTYLDSRRILNAAE